MGAPESNRVFFPSDPTPAHDDARRSRFRFRHDRGGRDRVPPLDPATAPCGLSPVQRAHDAPQVPRARPRHGTLRLGEVVCGVRLVRPRPTRPEAGRRAGRSPVGLPLERSLRDGPDVSVGKDAGPGRNGGGRLRMARATRAHDPATGPSLRLPVGGGSGGSRTSRDGRGRGGVGLSLATCRRLTPPDDPARKLLSRLRPRPREPAEPGPSVAVTRRPCPRSSPGRTHGLRRAVHPG